MARGLAKQKLTFICIVAVGAAALVGAIVLGQQPPPTYPSPPALPQGPPTGSFPRVRRPLCPRRRASRPPVYQPHAFDLPTPPPANPPAPPARNTQPQPPAPKRTQAPPESQLDQPLRWLYEARRNYTLVRDYTCTLRKQERVRGQLPGGEHHSFQLPREAVQRSHEMAVPAGLRQPDRHLRAGPKQRQHAREVAGPLGGGLIGWINVSPTDPRVLQHSRHTITEAGIGNMIDQLIRHLEIEKQFNKTIVRTANYSFDDRRCIRVETIRPQRMDAFQAYRTVVYLDKESKYPIRLENYDWPLAGGPAGGDLLEKFSYYSLPSTSAYARNCSRGEPPAAWRWLTAAQS